MKYFANFNANHGTTFDKPIWDTNKARIIKDIRDIAEGNRFAGNGCCWQVWYVDANGRVVVFTDGGMDVNGRRYRNK